MAEKEERTKDIIYVFSQELICKNCKDWYEHIDPLDKTDCDNCEDIADLPHISRQQAIERIATGYCGGICEKCTDGPKRSKHCIKWLKFRGTMEKAEAALNALLGEK